MAAAGHELKTPTAAHPQLPPARRPEPGRRQGRGGGDLRGRALTQTRRLATLIERLLDVEPDPERPAGAAARGRRPRRPSSDRRSRSRRSCPRLRRSACKAGSEPVPVRADAGRLEQVFLNLLANAMEHAPDSATIDVTVKASEGMAEVAVRDHGPGIAAGGHPHDVRGLHAARAAAPGTRAGSGPVRRARDRHGPRGRDRGHVARRQGHGDDRPTAARGRRGAPSAPRPARRLNEPTAARPNIIPRVGPEHSTVATPSRYPEAGSRQRARSGYRRECR